MIGIYGGTFDPVHNGHLRPALDVCTSLTLSKVLFIPCGQPPHRDLPVASAEHRLAMLKLAVEGQPDFIVDDREIKRTGPSYMVDTLMSLTKGFPDEKFCLILGMDAFVNLDTWKDWVRITDLVSIVITQRPQIETDVTPNSGLVEYINDNRTDDKALFLTSEQHHCFFCPVTQLDISATRIRDLIRNGHSIDYLVPEKVSAVHRVLWVTLGKLCMAVLLLFSYRHCESQR